MNNKTRFIAYRLALSAIVPVSGASLAATSDPVADSPVSQLYAIRAQVMEGVNLARSIMDDVAEEYAYLGTTPGTLNAYQTSGQIATGNYVAGIVLNYGRIEVTYGSNANKAIKDKILYLTPYETMDKHLIWRCGNDPEPRAAQNISGGTAYEPSTVATRYQSAACALVAGFPSKAPFRVDVIRAQVAEGLRLAEQAKNEVAKYGTSAAFLSAAAMSYNNLNLGGQYVSSIQIGVLDGEITITYGNHAASEISGASLILTPYIWTFGSPTQLSVALTTPASPLGAFDWSCISASGNFATSRSLPVSYYGSLPPQYAPPECR